MYSKGSKKGHKSTNLGNKMMQSYSDPVGQTGDIFDHILNNDKGGGANFAKRVNRLSMWSSSQIERVEDGDSDEDDNDSGNDGGDTIMRKGT